MSGFNSQQWFPLFRKLAAKYYDYADKGCIAFRPESIDEIELAYPLRLDAVKNVMFFDDPALNRIDRHKIIALYIQLFLEKKLFWLRSLEERWNNPSPSTLLINEIFCIDLMRIILQDWIGKQFDVNNFERYKYSFLKLLAYYREHCELHKPNTFNAFIFAHLIYFVENEFFTERNYV
jgi:hypothetical protein